MTLDIVSVTAFHQDTYSRVVEDTTNFIGMTFGEARTYLKSRGYKIDDFNINAQGNIVLDFYRYSEWLVHTEWHLKMELVSRFEQ